MTTLILLYTRKDCGMVFNIRYGMLNFYIVNDRNRNSFYTNINVLSFYIFKFSKKNLHFNPIIRNPWWCEPCQVIATLRVISHCLVNVRTCYPQTCWSKLRNYQAGRENIENYNIKNYTGVGDLINFKIIKSSKRKCLHEFLTETAYIMNVSYFVGFD